MNQQISMTNLASVLSIIKNKSSLYRAKSVDTNKWIYGFYVEGALTSGSKIADFALQLPNFYPVEIKFDTLCKYLPDLDCFEKDWLIGLTNTSPVVELEGFLSYNNMEYCIEQNDNTFPLCSFSSIDHLSIKKTELNIIDSPELLTF